ncbi:MoaD/ThiS family protein [Vibrio cholerae]|nr:MoaD/ThiS family protein [Vibrio cholerae]EJY4340680.1 MoaD/ThiS family protein [Vibrio cholerae]
MKKINSVIVKLPLSIANSEVEVEATSINEVIKELNALGYDMSMLTCSNEMKLKPSITLFVNKVIVFEHTLPLSNGDSVEFKLAMSGG